MALFGRKKEQEVTVQTAARNLQAAFGLSLMKDSGGRLCERKLYKALKDTVPLIDGALKKIVRLVGGFRIRCADKELEQEINAFLGSVRVNACGTGAESFLSAYLEELLTYGTAVGEIVTDSAAKNIAALYNASLDDVELSAGSSPFDLKITVRGESGERTEVRYPALVLCSVLMPESGCIYGTSVLKGLPLMGDILMKIYHAVGTNWDRVGNVRFAVSYHPADSERSFSKDRAKQIASEWSKAMTSPEPRDFVTVGDVSIKVIGAENQIPDSEVPVRQILEQILAKLGIPPFMLGLSWSSTERMSSQQADILTSELEYYRRILNGTIRRICDVWLRLRGTKADYEVVWDNINLQDEVELARARLYNAQAEQLEVKEA